MTALQKALIDYGYGLEQTGHYDAATKEVVTAFQRHFRPARVDGIADASTRDDAAQAAAGPRAARSQPCRHETSAGRRLLTPAPAPPHP